MGDVLVCLIQFRDYGLTFSFHALCGLGGTLYCLYNHTAHAYCLVRMNEDYGKFIVHMRKHTLKPPLRVLTCHAPSHRYPFTMVTAH